MATKQPKKTTLSTTTPIEETEEKKEAQTAEQEPEENENKAKRKDKSFGLRCSTERAEQIEQVTKTLNISFGDLFFEMLDFLQSKGYYK